MCEFEKRSTAIEYCGYDCYTNYSEEHALEDNIATRFRIEIIAADLREWKAWFTGAARCEVAEVDGMITPICERKPPGYLVLAQIALGESA